MNNTIFNIASITTQHYNNNPNKRHKRQQKVNPEYSNLLFILINVPNQIKTSITLFRIESIKKANIGAVSNSTLEMESYTYFKEMVNSTIDMHANNTRFIISSSVRDYIMSKVIILCSYSCASISDSVMFRSSLRSASLFLVM